MFKEEDADRILTTPLSKVTVSNKLIWEGSVSGQFSVRSAYYKAREILGKDRPQIENRSMIWKSIWMAKVVPKVRIFMWRLIHNIVPTVQNLRRKGLQLVNRCCVGQEGESTFHVLFECKLSCIIWGRVYPWVIEFLQRADVGDFWQGLFQQLHRDNSLELFCIICWLIWMNRTRSYHDSICYSPGKIIRSAKDLNDEYIQTTKNDRVHDRQGNIVWTPPPEGVLKLNTDAAFCEQSKMAKLGVVCRDSTGVVHFNAHGSRKEIQTPLQAELLALLFGLEIAIDKGYKNILLETDSLIAVTEIEKGFLSLCEWGNIIFDICYFIEKCDRCRVGHVKREANSLAHNLAKISGFADYDMIWRWELPSSVCNVDYL